jgi:hypothetical protein
MPLELGVWRIEGKGCKRVDASHLDGESKLEDLLDADITIASPNWMVIGRQVQTDYGGYIDLLAIDRDGNLVVIELKRNMTPRDVVGQVIDYASWVKKLKNDDISRLFQNYLTKYHPDRKGQSLDEAFCKRFQVRDMPEALNEDHEMVVVASALDDSTERIVKYLAEQHIAVNAVFFRIFRDVDREYLTRAWLIDPTEASALAGDESEQEDWNGEFYASFGHHPEHRRWEDARKYGFICAGYGSWYTKTLGLLEPGNRIWVNVPGYGYVGVGVVRERVTKIAQFMVTQKNGRKVPLKDVPLVSKGLFHDADDDEKADYAVAVEWLHTVPLEEAIKEKGFFGNQNTVCQPSARKWTFTVQRLKEKFGIKE